MSISSAAAAAASAAAAAKELRQLLEDNGLMGRKTTILLLHLSTVMFDVGLQTPRKDQQGMSMVEGDPGQ